MRRLFLALLLITAPAQAGVFDGLTTCQLSSNPAVLTSTCANVQPLNVARPDLYDGTSATQYTSAFGAKYMRISVPAGVTGAPTQMFPDYAKVPAWNSDGSKLLIMGSGGWWHLFDGKTYQWIKRLEHPANYVVDGLDVEPRWSHTDPDKFYYRSGMSLHVYSVSSNTSSVVRTFTNAELGTTDCISIKNGDEGNSDDTDRYWAFFCQAGSGSGYAQRAAFVYDRTLDQVLAAQGFGAGGLCGAGACPTTLNWLGVSHGGDNVVLQWQLPASDGDMTTRGKGTESFSRTLGYVAKVSEKNYHADLAQLADGTDVFVGGAQYTLTNAYKAVRAVKLSDGAIAKSCMLPDSQYNHVSGRSGLKGWVLYSTYDQTYAQKGILSDGGVFALEAFALNLDTCEVKRVAHTQSNVKNGIYYDEPHAVMSPSFDKVLWGSNWRVQGDPIQAYVAELGTAIPVTPTTHRSLIGRLSGRIR